MLKHDKRTRIRTSGPIPSEEEPAKTAGLNRRGVRRLSHFEWLAVAFALVVVQAALFRNLIYAASCCDAIGYRNLAGGIVDHGLFSAAAFDGLRTYGYPLFLSVLQLLGRLTSIPIPLLASEVQLCVY